MLLTLILLELRFHPKELSTLCLKDFSESVEPIVYYRIDDEIYPYFGNQYYSITYYLFYKDNFAIGLNGLFPNNINLGYHSQDIEHIRIIYNINTYNPEFVFFSAHAQEGIWIPYNQCKFNHNFLVAYISKNSHALRPKNKSYIRLFGFANDYTSDNGNYIYPSLIKDQSLPYLRIQNEEVFATPFKSFIMPLLINNSEKLKTKQQKKQNEINKNIL